MKTQIIKTPKQLTQWFNRNLDVIALDTESTCLDYLTSKIVCITMCNGESTCLVDLIDNPNKKGLVKILKKFFAEYEGTLIMQNSPYDIKVLQKEGLIDG